MTHTHLAMSNPHEVETVKSLAGGSVPEKHGFSKPGSSIPLQWLPVLGALLLAGGLSYLSSQGTGGWLSFLAVVLVGAGILAGGWLLLRSEKPPRWLLALVVLAALLRLAAGVLWYVTLPTFGHNTPAEQAGYVMSDAFKRDQEAFNLGRSEKPLWLAFEKYRLVDQYGGLLFLSAAVYRYTGGETHQPLLMVTLAACFSALAVIFTWAFARRSWGEATAGLAAWILALYPEAVLLGSSQMREAFQVSLAAAAFYGLVRFAQERTWVGAAWMAVAVLLTLPLSPPFAAALLGLLAVASLAFVDVAMIKDLLHRRYTWLVLLVVVVLVAAGLYLALRQFAPASTMDNPLAVTSYWLRKTADYQAHLSKRASGWVQKIFKMTPDWAHIPLLLVNGIPQPFLPAALVSYSDSVFWRWVVLWRSAGWTAMLLFLIYAPLLSFNKKVRSSSSASQLRIARFLSLVIWIGILVAAWRGGGDQWDNPRYRQAFAGLQAALAAWAWVQHRAVHDPGLRRIVVSSALFLFWFLMWYLQRYYGFPWPVGDLFKTLGLGLASAVLYLAWEWARTGRQPP